MKRNKLLLLTIICVLAIGLAAFSGEGAVGKGTVSEEEEVLVEVAEDENSEEPNDVNAQDIIATVNEEKLTGEKYNAVLRSIQNQLQEEGQQPADRESAEQIKKQALEAIIEQTLILQQAKEADIKVAQAEVEAAYKIFANQFKDEKAMKNELDNKDIDEETLKKQLEESLVFKKYQEKVAPVNEIKVSEKEIEDYYKNIVEDAKNNGQFPPPLKEVNEEIKEMIEQEKQQRHFANHLKELKKTAKIEVNI